MDDRRIDNLLRMVSEVEELERSAISPGVPGARVHEAGARPGLRVVGTEHAARLRKERRAWFVKSIGLAAMAACLGFAVRLSVQPPPRGAPGPGPVVASKGGGAAETQEPTAIAGHDSKAAPAHVEPAAPAAEPGVRLAARERSGEASVVLAIFEDATGMVRCVRWREHDFGAKGIEGLKRNELLAATYGDSCVVGPHQLIAVGLSGPRDKMPTTEAGVQAVAQCIIGGRPTCEILATASLENTPMSCVPNGLKMMVETLAMGK